MSYKVRLQTFEGPFDLLVYLIENAQMSIYDIRVSEITSQYMEYLDQMQRLNVNLSSEFMVLAAELIEIKSKMMLPRPDLEDNVLVQEDPRSELAARLAAYKMCKQQSEILALQEELMQGVFEKPQEDISVYLDNPDEYLSLNVADFARAFDMFLHRKQKIEETRRHYTRLERERVSMENRMDHIRSTFRKLEKAGENKVPFGELIPDKRDRYDVAISFMSVLQMMRERFLDAIQKKNYGEIIVKKGSRDFDEGPLKEEGEGAAGSE